MPTMTTTIRTMAASVIDPLQAHLLRLRLLLLPLALLKNEDPPGRATPDKHAIEKSHRILGSSRVLSSTASARALPETITITITIRRIW